jgi:hypothetical protein
MLRGREGGNSWTLLFGLIVLFLSIGGVGAQDLHALARDCARLRLALVGACNEHRDFAAKMETQVVPLNGAPPVWLSGDVQIRGDDVRQTFQLSKVPEIPAQRRAALASLGLDSVVVITRFKSKKVFLLFPELGAYCETEIPADAIESIKQQIGRSHWKRSDLGRENAAGYHCNKARIIPAGNQELPNVVTAWFAEDIDNFPVRIEESTPRETTKYLFSDVVFAKPDKARFEIPSGCAKRSDPGEIVKLATQTFLLRNNRLLTPTPK